MVLYFLKEFFMPFETYVIEPASTDGSRKHEQVAKDVTATFEKIAEEGGKFITAFALADKSSHSGAGGHPDGAVYIVAELPGSQDEAQ
jgi:hypothetical protein